MEYNISDTDLTSESAAIGQFKPNVADALFDRDIRLAALLAIIVIGSMGGALVCVWLRSNWSKKSRVHYVICNVTASDMLVLNFTCLMQLVWEWFDRRWFIGNIGCKFLKTFQGFSLMTSSFMVVILTFDRFQAVVYPLKPLCKTKKLTMLGWILGIILSSPQLMIFRENHITNGGPFHNKTVCESNFRTWPRWSRQVYLTVVNCVVFYIPFVVIILCYLAVYIETTKHSRRYTFRGYSLRLLMPCIQRKPRRTANDDIQMNKERDIRKGHGILIWSSQRAKSFALARMKTIKMAVVISTCFLVCVSPYHLLETWMSFGDHSVIPPSLMALLGSLAVLHSAVNPYVFLAFNIAWCKKGLLNCCRGEAKSDAKNRKGKRPQVGDVDDENITDTLKGDVRIREMRTIISADVSIKITSTTQFCDI